jgi:hypothetical protein
LITIEITNDTHDEIANLMTAAQRAEFQAKRIIALLVEGSGNEWRQVVETSFMKDESGKWIMTSTMLSDKIETVVDPIIPLYHAMVEAL